MKNNNLFIKKEEIKFWLAIIVLVVSFVVSYIRLESSVSAVQESRINLQNEYENSIIKIDKNLEIIKNSQESNTISIAEIKKDIGILVQIEKIN